MAKCFNCKIFYINQQAAIFFVNLPMISFQNLYNLRFFINKKRKYISQRYIFISQIVDAVEAEGNEEI